jgi:hypothetical protein
MLSLLLLSASLSQVSCPADWPFKAGGGQVK